jgi:hypothetical protein
MKRLNQTLLCVLPMVLLAGCGGDQTPDAALTCEAGVDALSVDGADATSASVNGDQAGACQANLYGNISDALSDDRVAGATLKLRVSDGTRQGEVVYTTTSDLNGQYRFAAIEADQYVLEVVQDGFSTAYFDMTLAGKKSTEKQYALSPQLEQGQKRIVLNWGASPSDLDAYLSGPGNEGETFEISYRQKEARGVRLDRDDTSSYGPETITILQQYDGEYRFWVRNYSAYGSSTSTGLSNSGATVSLYDETGLIQQFSVPQGAGAQWDVFTLNDGELTVLNQLH